MIKDGGSAGNRLLRGLKKEGGALSVKELCRRLDLSSMAVRRQLAILEGRGLVASRRKKQKTGRPARRYHLTDEGHERFERDYSNLAIDLLVATRALEGKERINELFRYRNQTHLQLEERVPGKTLEARVHEVTLLLSEQGYMATWEKLGPKRYLIKEMNCAVSKVARRFPQVCIHEQALLEKLLRAKVRRRHHILQKDHFCSYVVEG